MTKKDFELIARILKDNNAPSHLVEAFADSFGASYPRFDRVRFMRAALSDWWTMNTAKGTKKNHGKAW